MGALLAGVFCGVLLQVSIYNFFFFFLAFDKGGKNKTGKSLRCDREVRLLVSDGLRHDEWGNEKGLGENEVRREKEGRI